MLAVFRAWQARGLLDSNPLQLNIASAVIQAPIQQPLQPCLRAPALVVIRENIPPQLQRHLVQCASTVRQDITQHCWVRHPVPPALLVPFALRRPMIP
jgi:hypothetical protein